LRAIASSSTNFFPSLFFFLLAHAEKTIVIYLNVALANPASPEGQWFYILTAGDSGVGNVHASLATHKRERGLTLKFGA
jgi:hypothetical protein